MNWIASGIWNDENMPRIDNLTIPFWGYRTSDPFILRAEIEGVDIEIFTAFVIAWESVQPSTRENYVSNWFMLSPQLQRPFDNEDSWLIGVEWLDVELKIRTYLRSGIADIFPTWNGITSLSVVLADFLEVPDFQKIDEGISFKTAITKFELGHEQRRSKGTPRRNWVLTLRKDSPYAEAVQEFFREMYGQAQSFWWRSPLDGQRYRVRFADPNLARNVRWNIENTFNVGLLEVRDGEF